MGYTLRNLRDIKDSAPDYNLADTQEARFATDALNARQTGVAYLVVKPGHRVPYGHHHHEVEEVYVVIGGSGRLLLDDEWVEVSELDAICMSPEVRRGIEAGPDGLTYLAFGPRKKGDAEMLLDFWKQAGSAEEAEGAIPPASPPW